MLSSTGVAQPPITAARFTPDGTEVVVGSQAGIDVLSWPELNISRRLKSRLAHVHDLCFASDGSRLVAVGGRPAEEGSLESFSWPEATPQSLQTVGEDVLYCVAGGAGGRIAVGSGDRQIRVESKVDSPESNGRQPTEYRISTLDPLHSHPVLAGIFLPDGKTLVTAGVDQTLRVWDTDSGESLRTLAIHTAPVLGLAARPSPHTTPQPYIASVSEDRSVRLWQPTIGRMVRFARLDHVPLSVDWTADGNRIIVGCDDGTVRIIDPDSVKVLAEYPVLAGWVYTVAAHPARNEFFAAGTGGVAVRISLE